MTKPIQEARGECPVPVTSRCSCLEETPPFRTWSSNGGGEVLSGSTPTSQEHLAMVSLEGR